MSSKSDCSTSTRSSSTRRKTSTRPGLLSTHRASSRFRRPPAVTPVRMPTIPVHSCCTNQPLSLTIASANSNKRKSKLRNSRSLASGAKVLRPVSNSSTCLLHRARKRRSVVLPRAKPCTTHSLGSSRLASLKSPERSRPCRDRTLLRTRKSRARCPSNS